LDGCIGDASDGLSGKFWNTRKGITKNGANYDEYMDPAEVERTKRAGGGPFEIVLDPIIALEELRLAAESIKTISDAPPAPSSSAAGGEEEHTSCVRRSQGPEEKDLIVKDIGKTVDGLSQGVDDAIKSWPLSENKMPKDISLFSEINKLKSRLSQASQRLSQQASQQASIKIPHISSSIQAASASSARGPYEHRDFDTEQLEKELAAKRAAVEEKWKSSKDSGLGRMRDEYAEDEDDRAMKRMHDFYELPFGHGADDPDQGQGQPNWGDGGRRPRRQRRKTKRNNKQTKRRKQKTNKRVNKKQTKRIKKRRTKKV
jgi:hypothetical protein